MNPNIPHGEAYGFFGCKASKEEVWKEIAKISEGYHAPFELKLLSTEELKEAERFRSEKGFEELLDQAKEMNLGFVLKGSEISISGRRVAESVDRILNRFYETELSIKGKGKGTYVMYDDHDGRGYMPYGLPPGELK